MTHSLCMVRHCTYVATGAIEDFLVCSLHDAPATRGLLERLLAPAAYFAHEVPVVLPAGELGEDDFVVRDAGERAIDAWDDPQMEDVPEIGGMIAAEFDLRIRD